MKKLALLVMVFVSLSAFAGRSAEEVILEIEEREAVSCTFVSESRFELCLGNPTTFGICRWSKRYECSGASSFGVKLKMKSMPNYTRGSDDISVTKVIYIR
jgi:hypothetical protein